MNINLNLNLDQANLILEALGNAPYARVAALVGTITQQAQEQVQAAQQTPKVDQ